MGNGEKQMKQELRQIFHNSRFLGAVFIMLLCFSGYAALDWMDVYHLDVDIRPSALHEVVGCIFFGGVILLLPLCAALPASITQVEEIQSTFVDLRIIRSSVKKYTLYKFTSAFLSGALAVGIAFCIHSILWNIIATPGDVTKNEYLAIPFSGNCIYRPWQPIFYSLPIYIWMAFAISFCGGIWGIVGVTSALYVQDKLLSLAVPFCIYYIWHGGLLNAMIGKMIIPHPSDLFNDGLTLEVVISSVIVYLSIGVICAILYVKKLKKRVHNNA